MAFKIPGWSALQKHVTSRSLGYIMAALFLSGIVGLELTAQSIMRKMDDLRAGSFENSIWTISQFEVDLQRFLLALNGAIEVDPATSRQAAIAEVVKTFDIYFSRIAIVSTHDRKFAETTAVSTTSNLEMLEIEKHLRVIVPLIDGSTGQGPDYFRNVRSLASPLLPEVRRHITNSLQSILESDALLYSNRAGVLKLLLIITQGTAVSLCGIAFLISRLSWQLNRRTIDFARVSSNLNKAIETSLDAVIITDISGRISSYNSAAESMFGFTLAEVRGVLVADLLNSGLQGKNKRRLNGRQTAAKLARSANRGRIRLKLQKRDGTDFLVEIAIASDVDSDGAPIFMAFMRDISKLVEAHRAERAARYEAERSAAANARFLAVMSHEMRTPLHGIISALELLDGVNTPHEAGILRKIARDCVGTALEQIQEVLELALHDSMDHFEVILTFFPIEVSRIIIEQWQPLAAASKTSLTLTFDPSMSDPMLGNRRAFRSALGNLVGNAIKFTKGGTIIVRIGPTPDIAGSMRVEVIDTGIGIEPQHLTRIFEDFETVFAPSLKTLNASGLGLGIVRRAVGLMGGTLQLESVFGQGSRFWFDIPQSHALSARAGKSPVLPQIPSDPALTVLIVDDNAINRLLLAQMLERLGHTVEMANDGQVAVEAAARRRFDLILMDINMPGMNGVEATRLIRSGGLSAEVPIMGVTANALPQDLALFNLAGLNCTLVKPITSAALALQLRDLTRPGAVARPTVTPRKTFKLIAEENVRDLRDALPPDALAQMLSAALMDAGQAISDARGAPFGTFIANQLHHAAGSAAVIGASRLHLLLCELEAAARAGQHDDIGALLDEAASVRQNSDDWFKAALLQG